MKSIQILIFIFLVSGCSGNIEENREPTRPANISIEAFWVGGVDGGYWYLVHFIHDHRNGAVISIFDEEGELVIKRKFGVICRTDRPSIWIENIEQQITGYDGRKILLKSPTGREICWMQ